MQNRLWKKRFWFSFSLAVLVLGCLTLQTPLMAYSMSGMDCETEMMCGACGCVADTLSLPVSSDYSELALIEERETPKSYFHQEPRIHPPR